MANKTSNFPPAELSRLEGAEFVGETVKTLQALSTKHERPETVEELQERIGHYFGYCAENDKRPGIEQLCLSLGITRQTLLDWCNGLGRGKDRRWQEMCIQAKQLILAFLESVHLEGKINPVSGIFLLKCWGGYIETQKQEFSISQSNRSFEDEVPSIEEILKRIPEPDSDYLEKSRIASRRELDI